MTDEPDWSRRARAVGTLLAVVVGLAVSTVAAALAVRAGEVPVTVLPFGRALATRGLAPLVAARVAVVALLWTVADRWAPRYQRPLLGAAGLFWFLWGVWQAWVLLART